MHAEQLSEDDVDTFSGQISTTANTVPQSKAEKVSLLPQLMIHTKTTEPGNIPHL